MKVTNSHPLISVIIPTFNEEGRIERCLNSIQNQTYTNLEIIVVDDFSTDNTKEIIKKIAKQDNRVQYHKLSKKPTNKTNWRGYDINAGYTARNYGFKQARGEWLTTQDADDVSLLNRIEFQYEMAQKYKALFVTIDWQELKSPLIGKTLNTNNLIREKGEEKVVVDPKEIIAIANSNKGPLMKEPYHFLLPFPMKWFPLTRNFFYRKIDRYPGADNSMFFHTSIRDAGYYFRHRNKRTWGVPSGRGTGRDFAFRVAHDFKNSWSFKIPLYLWDVNKQNAEYVGYNKYLE